MAQNRSQKKSFLTSTLITLLIVAMLVLSGPVQAVQVAMNAAGINNRIAGQTGFFYINVTIGANERIPVANITVNGLPDILGSPGGKLVFNVSDANFSAVGGYKNIDNYNITLVERIGWVGGSGTSYGYSNNTPGAPYFGYGYGYQFFGYGYGYNNSLKDFTQLKYKVTVNTDGAAAGTYSAVARLNAGVDTGGQFRYFSSVTTSFTLKIPATVEITPRTLNLKSQGVFTANITLPSSYSVANISNATVMINGAPRQSSEINLTTNSYIAKFRTQDLVGVSPGDNVVFTATGNLLDGTPFEGSDTIRVISPGAQPSGPGTSTGGLGVSYPSEDPANIGAAQSFDVDFRAGVARTVAFTNPDLWIQAVTLIPLENELGVKVLAQSHRGRSRNVPVSAPGTQYMALWVGTRKIKEGVIKFRVPNSWLASEGIMRPGDVTMYRWTGSMWESLVTTGVSKDDTSTYYEAKTTAFSYFAVTGVKALPPAVSPTATPSGITPTATAAPEITAALPEAALPVNLAVIVVVFVLIALVVVLYLSRKIFK